MRNSVEKSLLARSVYIISICRSSPAFLRDWITLSPKKIKPPLSSIYQFANELKVVIYNQDDFKWAAEQEKLVNPSCLLYLQPEWSRLETIQSDIIEFISRHPRWKLSLQTHKYLNIK